MAAPLVLAAVLGVAVGALAQLAFGQIYNVEARVDSTLLVAAALVTGLTLPVVFLLGRQRVSESDLVAALRTE